MGEAGLAGPKVPRAWAREGVMIGALIVCAVYFGTVAAFVALMSLWLRLEGEGGPPARLWRAALREVVWATLMQLLMPLALFFWPRRWRRARRPGEVPILFVHGYGQNRADFYALAARLARRGRGSLFALNYWPFTSVARSAARVARAVESVRATTGARKIHLVGHSLGGLVCRHYLERLDGERWVRRLVAVAAPLAGSRRAWLAPGRSARELRPAGAYLSKMGPLVRGQVQYHSIWSRADVLVVPAAAASLKGIGPERVVDDAGHLSVLALPETAETIAGWLDNGLTH